MQSLRPRTFIPTLAAAAALVTGCGSAATSSQAGSAAADAMPAGALAYADVNLDRGSDAWKQFTTVGQRFPSWQRFTEKALKQLDNGKSGTSFTRDIQPWLGDHAAIALTGIGRDGPTFVVYAASTDDEAARKAEQRDTTVKADGEYKGYSQYRQEDGYAGVGNGAVLLANDEATLHAAIDAREGDAASLSDDAAFTAEIDALPAESLVRGWANTAKLGQLTSLASLPGVTDGPQALQIQQIAKALDRMASASFAFWATDGGYNATFRVTAKGPDGDGMLDGVTFNSSLSDLVPSDAYGYGAFKGSDKQISRALEDDSAPFTMLERETGISIANDVLPLFTGEGLFYAAPGLPIRGALMLDPSDPQAAQAGLTHLVGAVANLEKSIRVADLPGGGQKIQLSPAFSLFWRQAPGGPLVLGNDPDAGSAPAQALVDSPVYRAFLTKAGVGDGTVNLYLDVPSALSFLPDLPPDVRPVGGVGMWSTKSGNTATTNLFVEIKG